MVNIVTVGYSVKAHGTVGAIVFSYATSFPERLKRRRRFILHDPISHEIIILERKEIHLEPGRFRMSFREIVSREEAGKFLRWELCVSRSEIEPLTKEDEFYYFELCGLKAVDASTGTEFGEVVNVIPHLPHELVEVRLISGETRLFPFVKAIVKEVDLKRGVIVIQVLPIYRT